MCIVLLVVDKWSIHRFKVEKHDVVKRDVFFHNAFQDMRFGNLNLEPNLPSHYPWKWKKESMPKKLNLGAHSLITHAHY